MPNNSRPEPLPFGGSVAQNIWKQSARNPPILTQAVTDWFNERHSYDYYTATCEPNEVCGHYRIVSDFLNQYPTICNKKKNPIRSDSGG